MAISYNKLWKLLVDKKMSKADLRKAAGIAPNTMTRLRRDEEVALSVLNRICVALDVNIGDTIISEEKSNKLEDVVFKYARMLEDSYSDELLQEFSNNLKRKIPNYEWLLNAFKNIGWG
jgi:predicted transcriptional regulator